VLRSAAIAFAVLTLLSTAARAQEYRDDVCPAKPPAEKRAQRWAGRWFAKGEQAAKETRFQEALDDFLCSLHLRPHQNTVFNVAQLTNLVEDKASATASIKKFREEHPNGEFDDELSDLLVSLEKAQGIEPSEAPVAEPPAPEPAPKADSADVSAAATESGPKKGVALRATGVVAITASGATLVVGIVLAAMAGTAKKDAEGASDYDAFRASEDDMKGRQAGAAVMFVMTGVLAGSGALMVAVGRRGKEPGGGAQVEVTPGPVGLSITGRF
jgi:hypothetical protein